MRYLIEIALTVEAGKELEAREGGVGPVVGRLLERFKPETVYFVTTERTIVMVADLAGPDDLAELMLAGTFIAGAYPKFRPVATAEEFPLMVEKVYPAANSILNG